MTPNPTVMAATPAIGLAHVTVVPTNYAPPGADDRQSTDEPPAHQPAGPS